MKIQQSPRRINAKYNMVGDSKFSLINNKWAVTSNDKAIVKETSLNEIFFKDNSKMTYDDDQTRKLNIQGDNQIVNFWTVIGFTMMTIGAFLGVVAWL